MMKKVASVIGAGAILLGMATPAFGWFPFWGSDDISIRNKASVKNFVTTKSDTGDNAIGGWSVFGGDILTGDAGAVADVGNDVNSSGIGDVSGDVKIKNRAYVRNYVYTKADTGDNGIGGMFAGGGLIDTGDAGAASAVTNIVNLSSVGLFE